MGGCCCGTLTFCRDGSRPAQVESSQSGPYPTKAWYESNSKALSPWGLRWRLQGSTQGLAKGCQSCRGDSQSHFLCTVLYVVLRGSHCLHEACTFTNLLSFLLQLLVQCHPLQRLTTTTLAVPTAACCQRRWEQASWPAPSHTRQPPPSTARPPRRRGGRKPLPPLHRQVA